MCAALRPCLCAPQVGKQPPPGCPTLGALSYQIVMASYRPGLPPVLRDFTFNHICCLRPFCLGGCLCAPQVEGGWQAAPAWLAQIGCSQLPQCHGQLPAWAASRVAGSHVQPAAWNKLRGGWADRWGPHCASVCLLSFFRCMGFAVVIDCRQPWHAELPCLLYRFCQGGGVHVVEQSRLVLFTNTKT